MRALLDTNILIDYISIRSPFTDDAQAVLKLCMEEQINGCIAAHSVMNVFYILRKEFTVDERKSTLADLCRLLTVVGIDKEKIVSAIENGNFSDILPHLYWVIGYAVVITAAAVFAFLHQMKKQ